LTDVPPSLHCFGREVVLSAIQAVQLVKNSKLSDQDHDGANAMSTTF